MTYVSGVVQDWLQVALEQEDQGVHHAWLYSWSSFVKEIYTYFGIPDIVAEAAHSLDHLRMNPDDRIAIYNVAFCHKLHSAISPSILHRFSRSQWLRKALKKTFRSVPVILGIREALLIPLRMSLKQCKGD